MDCYAMVRGSGIRLTDLDATGRYDSLNIRSAASKSVVRIAINEVTTGSGSNEVVRNDDDEPRLHFVKPDEALRYDLDINFLRTDPEILQLMTGVPLAFNAGGDIVGFDAQTRLPVKAFALEVWSKLTGFPCVSDLVKKGGFGEANFGEFPFGDGGMIEILAKRPYGYTLFPFLKGGTVGGFSFANGLVSFNVKGARTQRGAKWGVGPYDLEGPYLRLLKPVSRNTTWKTLITTAPPPAEQAGVSTSQDIIDGNVGPDILDGNVGPYVVSGN